MEGLDFSRKHTIDNIPSRRGITECNYNGKGCIFTRGIKTNVITTKRHSDSDIRILVIQQSEISQLTQQLSRFNYAEILILNQISLDLLPICICSFSHLSLLDISNNCLSSLPQDIANLTSLTLLNVSKNHLVDITAICELSHLQSLDVTENQLTELPRSFWKLGELKNFSCSFNKIACLPEEIGWLKFLTALRITNNRLSTLPRSFSNLTGLLLLQLDGNVFDHIPLQIFSCISLLELSLSHNIIEGSIPAKICSLVNLRTLNLRYNRVIAFPAELEQLASLKYLDVSGNLVEPTTISFGKLIRIQQFSASKCGLSIVPDDLSLCSNLVILDLSENRIGKLANESLSFPQLTSLCLAYNIISTLPFSICGLNNLVVLELQFNKLSSLPEDFGRLSYTLRQLDLGHNEFEVIPMSLFCGRSRLSYLCLDANPISEVPNEISNLKELIHLSISYCRRLESLPEGLGLCTNLCTLKVSKNKLSSLPKTLSKLESLKYLDLSDNDFNHFPLVVCSIPRLRVLLYDQTEGRPLIPTECPNGWYKRSLLLYPEMNDSFDSEYEDYSEENAGTVSLVNTLSKTSIKGLPSMIGNLKHLVHLSLQSNGLYMLPDVFHNMMLRRLNVSHNRLQYLPPNLHRSKCLTHLYLHNNNIDHLDQNIRNLKTLNILTLDQNPLLCPPVEVGAERVFPVYSYLRNYKTFDEFILKSLCEILINNFPKENTHILLRKIGFSDSMIESLEKQFPGGHNHIKRLKVAFQAWTGFSFGYEDLGLNIKSRESYSDQQLTDSKNFNTSDILAERDKKLVVQNQPLQSELHNTKNSFSSINEIFKETNLNSYINSHRLLHIVHLIGLDELHSKLMQYLQRAQQVRF
ncbi:unnamed protein product [Schistosoma rodhaini]|uniref:PPM-type phosphatase domain-containing protein n=1 Tax=Schistosoma rodhaini TaxID=6188 RepID=A0AA85F206_9TREM|nr:unnamed protein product [Schistosoma rodhaini]